MKSTLFVLAIIALAGCASPRTEMLLVVGNDGLSIPGQLDGLTVTITDPNVGGTAVDPIYSKSVALCATASSGCYTLPLDFTLLPGSHSPNDPVVIEVQGTKGGTVVIDDIATFKFEHGKSQRLDFTLSPSCLGTECETSQQACVAGACVTLSPTSLTGKPDLAAGPVNDGGSEEDLGVPDLAMGDLTTSPDLSTMLECGDSGVVDTTSNPDHCGSCSNVCTNPNPAQNTAATCSASTCGIGCQTGWADCNSMASDGCEHDVSDDVNNCGACNHVCGNANTVGAMAVCAQEKCVFNCSPGTAHCGTNDATGCETTIATDANNCGSCGFSCGSAPCVDGFCRYTAGNEQLQAQDSANALQADATALYWENVNGGVTGDAIRTVKKDGTGLGNVFPSTTSIGGPDEGGALAVDQNYLYWFNDTYKTIIFKGVKSGAQDATQLKNTGNASGTGIYLDSDTTANATYLFYTQALNGPGFFRVTIATAAQVQLYGAGEARGFTRSGTTGFFGSLADNSIQYFDMTAASPTLHSLTTLASAPHGLATDGTNIYATANDDNLYAVSIATGNTTTVATGAGVTRVVTDGTNLYAIDGAYVYKVPIGTVNMPFSSFKYVSNQSLPVNASMIGVEVDANALYFATEADVYKTKK